MIKNEFLGYGKVYQKPNHDWRTGSIVNDCFDIGKNASSLSSSISMDLETGCGFQSTGQKERLLIGTACCFCLIGWISAAAVRPLAWVVAAWMIHKSVLSLDQHGI